MQALAPALTAAPKYLSHNQKIFGYKPISPLNKPVQQSLDCKFNPTPGETPTTGPAQKASPGPPAVVR